MAKQRTYIAIDLKSFYASQECIERELDPMTTNLVVDAMAGGVLNTEVENAAGDTSPSCRTMAFTWNWRPDSPA